MIGSACLNGLRSKAYHLLAGILNRFKQKLMVKKGNISLVHTKKAKDLFGTVVSAMKKNVRRAHKLPFVVFIIFRRFLFKR